MNKTITEKLETKICGEYDIIVVGAGPAGIAAAITAARNDAKVLLVERALTVGGMWTEGLVNPLFDIENKTGLAGEIRDRLKKENNWGGFWDISFRTEDLKYMIEQMLVEAGVTLLGNTYFSKSVVEDNEIRGIIVENKDGRCAYMAKLVIDCTGDGDVCASAAVPFDYGDSENHSVQSSTLMFLVAGTDFRQKDAYELSKMLDSAAEANGIEYKCPFNRPFIINLPDSALSVVQLTHVNCDATNAKSVTESALSSKKQVMDTVKVMKTIPEFKNIELVETAPMMGIRESRRIRGEYCLTYDDVRIGREFEDGVTVVTFGIDIHPDANNGVQKCMGVKPYEIPIRSMIAYGIKNLMMAGRCISASHEAMASLRVTGDCLAMGDACGLTASFALKNNINIRDVDIKRLLIQRDGKI